MRCLNGKTKTGLTLIEVVVVIAVIAILASLLLMAVQAAREGSRKVTCLANIKQVALGIQSYESQNRCFPSSAGNAWSFHARLLPFMGEDSRYAKFNLKEPFDQSKLTRDLLKVPAYLVCPTDPDTNNSRNTFATNYVGIAGGGVGGDYTGAIVPGAEVGGRLTAAAISDGLSNTLLLAETSSFQFLYEGSIRPHLNSSMTYATTRGYQIPLEFPAFSDECFSENPLTPLAQSSLGSHWLEASIGMNSFTCVFTRQKRNCANSSGLGKALIAPSSVHADGFYVARCDGSAQLFSNSADASLWQALGTRAGGEVISN